MNDVTVLIPTIPTRRDMLMRALASVYAQTYAPDALVVVTDRYRAGSARNRNYGLTMVRTEWVAFLDDDDELDPSHLAELLNRADDNVDVVYSGCRVLDPLGNEIIRRREWGRFGEPFDGDELLRYSWLPVTSLCRTSLAQRAGFVPHNGTDYDDWGFYVRMIHLGARFQHVPVVTWTWHHHGKNTSGRSDRW